MKNNIAKILFCAFAAFLIPSNVATGSGLFKGPYCQSAESCEASWQKCVQNVELGEETGEVFESNGGTFKSCGGSRWLSSCSADSEIVCGTLTIYWMECYEGTSTSNPAVVDGC